MNETIPLSTLVSPGDVEETTLSVAAPPLKPETSRNRDDEYHHQISPSLLFSHPRLSLLLS